MAVQPTAGQVRRLPGRAPLAIVLPAGTKTHAVYVAGKWRGLPPVWGLELHNRRSRSPYLVRDGRKIPVRVEAVA